MSQDLFDDMDCDDPDQLMSTPTEFSGVSATSSTSPASHAVDITPTVSQPSPSVAVAPVVSPSGAQVFCCTECKSKLTTVRGMKKHLLTKHNIVTDDAGVLKYLITPLPPPPTAPTSAPIVVTPSTSQAPPGFLCADCKKTLKTESGFIKHRATHKINDALKRKPQAKDFDADIRLATVTKITNEILAEPSYDENMKKKFLEEFLSKAKSDEWLVFVNILSDKICEFVCEKQKKIMPLNQYEECQQKLQEYLSNDENMLILSEKLQLVCTQKISSILCNRLVFRFSLKLLWEIQAWVAKSSRNEDAETQTNTGAKEKSETEKNAFVQNLGEMIQAFYRKNYRSEIRLGQTQCACICDKFLDGQHPISSSSMLDKRMWFSGNEDSIVVTDNAVEFFILVENAVVACEGENVSQEVTDSLLDNHGALNLWFFLTSNHFSEDQSLLFMKDMIRIFIRKSLLFNERQKNRSEEKSVRASKVALRTHLQKNYSEKETTGDANTNV